MKITKDMLVEWGACQGEIDWFEENFPSLEEDYQEILNRLAEENRKDYAEWLLKKAGQLNTEIKVEEIATKNSFFFAGKIIVSKGISVGFNLLAGRGIEAGLGIKAGEGIKAGWGIEAGRGIKAGRGIEAGDGFGVFAGVRVRIANWSVSAGVSANIKPKNLISGHWKGG